MAASKSNEMVKVSLRIRPLNEREKSSESIAIESISERKAVFKNTNERKTFEFDNVFSPASSQKIVYENSASNIIENVLEGYNGTIMAYGATGTGKSYTMFGNSSPSSGTLDKGIILRSLDQIFQAIEKDKEFKWEVSISYIQIYCEMIQDLLRPQSNNLIIREDPRRGTFIEGCSSFKCSSQEQCLKYLKLGDENRTVACTAMNATSSRSHACVMINLEKRLKTFESEKANTSTKVLYGKLFLVDLAGSERVGKSQVFGRHFSELKSINLSLSALGNCISALAEKSSHVPYRDAKLTRLLSDSLGGNSKTSLIITVGPSSEDYFEISQSITFGQRAMKVQNEAHVNMDVDYKSLYLQLQGSIDLKDDKIHELEISLEKSQQSNQNLQKRLEETDLQINQLSSELSNTNNNYKLSVEAMKKIASDQGSDSLKSVEAVNELNLKCQKDIEILREDFVKSVQEIRSEASASIEESKHQSIRANEEWHAIEYELKNSREEHLETLKQLRLSREEMALKDKEMSNRIAELLAEKEDSQNDLLEKANNTIVELSKALDASNVELESNKDQFQCEMETLDNLYIKKIEALALRVNQLENSNNLPDPNTFRSSSSGSSNNNNNNNNNYPFGGRSSNLSDMKFSTLTKPVPLNLMPHRNNSLKGSATNSILRGSTFSNSASNNIIRTPIKSNNWNK